MWVCAHTYACVHVCLVGMLDRCNAGCRTLGTHRTWMIHKRIYIYLYIYLYIHNMRGLCYVTFSERINFNQFSKSQTYIFSVAFQAYGFQNENWKREAISLKQNSTHILYLLANMYGKHESRWLIIILIIVCFLMCLYIKNRLLKLK